jgi:hypothetical protein
VLTDRQVGFGLGSLFEKGRKRAHRRERPLSGGAVAVLRVEEVYLAAVGEGVVVRLL